MAKMRKDRHAKFVQEMKESGHAVALVMEPRNVRYTTGYYAASYHAGSGWAIVPVEGTPILWAHGDVGVRRENDWIRPEDIRGGDFPMEAGAIPEMLAARREQVAKEIKTVLEDRKLAGEVLVLENSMPAMQAALEKVSIKTRVDPQLGIKAMEVKTAEEIECFRVLTAICDIVHWETATYAGPGMTELAIVGYFRNRALQYGCDMHAGGFCMSGEHTWPNYRNSGDRLIRPGDIVFWDLWGIQWNGYGSCYYRPYSVGYKASQAAQDALKRVHEFHYNAITEIKPGKTTADMVKHYPEPRAMHIHGLGLDCYLIPPLSGGATMYPCELKEGQVFALGTPGGRVGDGQAVDLEDMILVTKTGAEVLSRAPSDVLITIPIRDDQDYVFRSPEEHMMEAKARLKLPG
jgi:Xaa-Pro aminopeptidase